MSTQARRCCGASISMAGRRARISLSRSSAASSNTRERFERDDGNSLQGVIELAGNADVDGLAGMEIAGKREPAVAVDEAELGLTVGAGADGGRAEVADAGAFEFEFGEKLERGRCAAAFQTGGRATALQIALNSQFHPRVRFQPLPLGA